MASCLRDLTETEAEVRPRPHGSDVRPPLLPGQALPRRGLAFPTGPGHSWQPRGLLAQGVEEECGGGHLAARGAGAPGSRGILGEGAWQETQGAPSGGPPAQTRCQAD